MLLITRTLCTDNDILTHFFYSLLNPPLKSPIYHHITPLKKIKIDNWRMMEVVS